MIDYALLAAILVSGMLAIFLRDNVYAAVSLAAAAASVALYYALAALFPASFIVLVIYIGSVMLLVLITAAMYGGVQTRSRGLAAAGGVLAALALALGVPYFLSIPTPVVAPGRPPADLDFFLVLLAVMAATVVVAVETARGP